MKRENFDHGFPQEVWEAAKAQARRAMIAVAAREGVIYYSDLVAEIRSIDLEPQSTHLAHMLGEISTEEHEAGRRMLAVVVVHKGDDHMLGPGFFELARSLGRDTMDREAFWVAELAKAHRMWSCGEKSQDAAVDVRSRCMREDAARKTGFEVGTALTLASGRGRRAAETGGEQGCKCCAGNRGARFESAAS